MRSSSSTLAAILLVIVVVAAALYAQFWYNPVPAETPVRGNYPFSVISQELQPTGVFSFLTTLTPVPASDPTARQVQSTELGKDDISHYN